MLRKKHDDFEEEIAHLAISEKTTISYRRRHVLNLKLHICIIRYANKLSFERLNDLLINHPFLNGHRGLPIIENDNGQKICIFEAILEHSSLTSHQKSQLIYHLLTRGEYNLFIRYLLLPNELFYQVVKEAPFVIDVAYEIHLRKYNYQDAFDHKIIWEQIIKNNYDHNIANILVLLKNKEQEFLNPQKGVITEFIKLMYSKCNTESEVNALSERLKSCKYTGSIDLTNVVDKEENIRRQAIADAYNAALHSEFAEFVAKQTIEEIKTKLQTLPPLSINNQKKEIPASHNGNVFAAIYNNPNLNSETKRELLTTLCKIVGYEKWEYILIRLPFIALFKDKQDLICKNYFKAELSKKEEEHIWDIIFKERITKAIAYVFNDAEKGLNFFIHCLKACRTSAEVIELNKFIEPLLSGTPLAASHSEIIKMSKLRCLKMEWALKKENRKLEPNVDVFLKERLPTIWKNITKNWQTSSSAIYQKINKNNLNGALFDIENKEKNLEKAVNSKFKTKIHLLFDYDAPLTTKELHEGKEEKRFGK